MKGKEEIINFIVIVALLGYIITSILLFKEAFNQNEGSNPALMYITSALTGLVGGIVAAAFGVKVTPGEGVDATVTTQSATKVKFQRVGEFAMKSDSNSFKEKLGNLYTWAYILVGITSIVIWAMLGDKATQSITNTGTTFVGMMVAIVGAFFKD